MKFFIKSTIVCYLFVLAAFTMEAQQVTTTLTLDKNGENITVETHIEEKDNALKAARLAVGSIKTKNDTVIDIITGSGKVRVRVDYLTSSKTYVLYVAKATGEKEIFRGETKSALVTAAQATIYDELRSR